MKSMNYTTSKKGVNMKDTKDGKHIFGTVKVGERGQIVIPKEAREIFDIKAGDQLLVLGDENQGLAIVKAELMKEFALEVLQGMGILNQEENKPE